MILLGVFFSYSFFEFSAFFAYLPLFIIKNEYVQQNKIIIIFLFIYTMITYKMACCETSDTDTLRDVQVTATQIVFDQMTDAERDDFLRAIHYRPVNGWEAVDYYHGYGEPVQQPFNYQGLLLWLAGSTLLFIIARWGDVITDFLFSLPSRAVHVVPDVYEGLTVTMRAMGREALFRQDIIQYMQHPDMLL